MAPEVIIRPSEGDKSFKPKSVVVSKEALLKAAPSIFLAGRDPTTFQIIVSDELVKELASVTRIFAEAAKES